MHKCEFIANKTEVSDNSPAQPTCQDSFPHGTGNTIEDLDGRRGATLVERVMRFLDRYDRPLYSLFQ